MVGSRRSKGVLFCRSLESIDIHKLADHSQPMFVCQQIKVNKAGIRHGGVHLSLHVSCVSINISYFRTIFAGLHFSTKKGCFG